MSIPIWERQCNGSKKARVAADVGSAAESMKAKLIADRVDGEDQQTESCGEIDAFEQAIEDRVRSYSKKWTERLEEAEEDQLVADIVDKYEKIPDRLEKRRLVEETCDVPPPRQIPHVMINQGMLCIQEEVYELSKLVCQIYGLDEPAPGGFEPAGCLAEALGTFPGRVELLRDQISEVTTELKELLL